MVSPLLNNDVVDGPIPSRRRRSSPSFLFLLTLLFSAFTLSFKWLRPFRVIFVSSYKLQAMDKSSVLEYINQMFPTEASLCGVEPLMQKIQEMELDPKKFAELLDKIEAEADEFLLARNQMVENDKERNVNREALTTLSKRARTTKDIHGSSTKPLVQEICSTCGSQDSSEPTWMMLLGADLFAAIPFHAVHTMLEKSFILFTFFATLS
ncbi:Vps53-like N-terminal [Arabidopsis thaliana x Arabidopsis arenosa]|uniref:Vps53-like N-terminal n=1 Tax=Arabidopsis thaliana x Arabidopsis arenosa TaxID=1240361 RepID=A0A8T1Y5B1_9BRAS|nr:Vps53-like N-terminal [Arabidopsis thaliana x Arabidopsis arenosa]